MSGNPVLEKLKQIDAYPKTLDDYRIRTLAGGTVTIISYVIMGLLCFAELQVYMTPDVIEELFVDTSRTPKLKINLNITVPHIPCKYLALDAMDTSGEQHFQIEHDVYKTPIDVDGNPIAAPKKEDVGANSIPKQNGTEIKPKCGSCYGAELPELNITCCNTCAQVREAYLKKRWAFPSPESIEQCKNDLSEISPTGKEGCNIYGSMEVNRVGGSFHIAPGQSFSINHVHVHDVQPFTSSAFNTTHIIEHLSFGFNIPGKTNPIDGVIGVASEDATLFQYYIKIVPMTYLNHETGETLLTNQFSVTRHQKSDSGHSGMPPGIFCSYELAPMMVKYTEKRRSFGHFATNVCAIIGGVFTVASIIDGVLYRSLQSLQQKIEIGKVY